MLQRNGFNDRRLTLDVGLGYATRTTRLYLEYLEELMHCLGYLMIVLMCILYVACLDA